MSDRRLPERVTAVLLRPALRVLLRRHLRLQTHPTHDDRAIVSGAHPLRLLIVGAGMAVGYGTESSAPSLPRQLATALADATGRGAIVESRAQASVQLQQTIGSIGMVGAATFDVVVWSPTLEEIFRGGSARWARELRAIVKHLQATGPAHLRVLLMGVPTADGEHVLQRSGSVLAESVDRRIARVAAALDRVEHVPVPSRFVGARDTPLYDPAYQQEVVAALVDRIAARLRASASAGSVGLRQLHPRTPDVAGSHPLSRRDEPGQVGTPHGGSLHPDREKREP